MMEKYKQQMKAYRRKRMAQDNTPFLPPDGNVHVMDFVANFVKQHQSPGHEEFDVIGMSGDGKSSFHGGKSLLQILRRTDSDQKSTLRPGLRPHKDSAAGHTRWINDCRFRRYETP